ncbi:hypothetical protein D3C86_1582980 [compost metagenome]
MLGVAGDEQHPEVGPQLPADFRQLPAIHAGQADIADQQVDALGRIEYRHGAITITGLDEGITQIAQHRTDQDPHRRIVLDNQHRLAIIGER